MELWEQDAFELLGQARFVFAGDGLGEFGFIAVRGQMDCRFGARDGAPFVEFSWEGDDEGEPAFGRGWAVVNGDELVGRIFFHRGDDSAFRATRKGTPPLGTKGRKKAR